MQVAAGAGQWWPRWVPGQSPVAVSLLSWVQALWLCAVTLVPLPLGTRLFPALPLGAGPPAWPGTTLGRGALGVAWHRPLP